MFCSECGVENVDGSGMCRSCGSILGLTGGGGVVKAAEAKTSGLAIAALVLGILSLFTFFLTFLPAVICGVIALVKVSNSGGALKGKGFAITGMALPVASIPVYAMLLAILMPALGTVKEMAQRVVCGTNLQQIGSSMSIYASDNDGQFPPVDKWCDVLVEEVSVDPMLFKCQSASEGRCNYAMNENIAKLGGEAPSDMVLVFESGPGWNLSGGVDMLTADNHRGAGANILFADGYVEFVKVDRFGSLNWTGSQ